MVFRLFASGTFAADAYREGADGARTSPHRGRPGCTGLPSAQERGPPVPRGGASGKSSVRGRPEPLLMAVRRLRRRRAAD